MACSSIFSSYVSLPEGIPEGIWEYTAEHEGNQGSRHRGYHGMISFPSLFVMRLGDGIEYIYIYVYILGTSRKMMGFSISYLRNQMKSHSKHLKTHFKMKSCFLSVFIFIVVPMSLLLKSLALAMIFGMG